MGTTAEKGARVLQSIAEVQEGINNLGGSLTDQTPFKDFKTELDNIYDTLPKTSFQEGTEVTIENGLKGKIDFDTDNGKKIVGKGDTEQDGEPTPSTPVAVECVTGEQEIVESGKNVFNGEFRQGNQNQTNISIRIFSKDNNWKLKAGETYTISTNIDTSVFKYALYIAQYPYLSVSPLNTYLYESGYKTTSSFTFTCGADGYFGFTVARRDETAIVPSDVSSMHFQVEQGSTATTYEPYHTPITYPISLGDRKVFEGDYFWRDINGKFYHHHAYQYELFKNGTINRMQTTVSGKYRFSIAFSKLAKAVPNNDVIADIYSNILIKHSGNQIYQAINGIGINMSGAIHFCYDSFSAYTIEEMTSYFSNKNDYIVYPLAEETDEEITDTTLIEQLENWYNSISFNGTTILESNGDLPMIIKVRALKGE